MLRRDCPLAPWSVLTTSPLRGRFAARLLAVGVMGYLLTATSSVLAAPARVGVLSEAALAMVTHPTCTVVPMHRSGRSRYVLIEGPSCAVGGGSCDHVAVVRIDGKTRTLMRKAEPTVAASGAFRSEFVLGEFHLRVDYAALPPQGRGKRSAKLQLQTATGQEVVTGLARCGDG